MVSMLTRRGKYQLCDLDVLGMWLQRAASNCYSCLDPSHNVCKSPSRLTYNQYLVRLKPGAAQANLLSLKAFLMTQDLRRARMVLWVDDPAAVYTNETAAFFDTFAEHITIKRFDYQQEIRGTLWEGDPFFRNGSYVRSFMPMAGAWSDVVRILLLHKYGDFWMDNDVVLYTDVTHLLDTSYQFVMRWMNLHIMRMQPGSELTHRAMRLATLLPLDHPRFQQDVMDKLCKPNGYMPAHPMYKGTDIYNSCLHRVLLRVNNTGPPGAVLYDLPLGWWDHDWAGCFNTRKAINDSDWRRVAGSFLAMHNRYPKEPDLGDAQPPSPLRRVIEIVDDFFALCASADCMPVDGMPLLAYEGIRDAPGKVRRTALRHLSHHLQAALPRPLV
ncbi:hypothetical protein OEZ86_000152 [Tetradesmus obliquus]|nr:hypothetical protein OEZ86_000152 [Tetradesmus obliquus]